METKTILKQLKNNADGVSLNLKGLKYEPKNGYFVALTDNCFNSINSKTIRDLQKQAITLNLKNYYLGYWLDKKTSKHYLDISIFIKSKTKALKIAKQYKQKAIFNCNTLDSIYL